MAFSYVQQTDRSGVAAMLLFMTKTPLIFTGFKPWRLYVL